MADIKSEPKELIIQRTRQKIAEMQLNLLRAQTRKLEIAFELERLEDNEKATEKAIADLELQIKELEK